MNIKFKLIFFDKPFCLGPPRNFDILSLCQPLLTNPGRFGPIPVRSGGFGPGRFGPISGGSRFGPFGAGRFGPIP